MTPELRLMVAPARTYASLIRHAPAGPVGRFTPLRRPLLVALVLGVSMAISTTRRVTPALVIDTTLAWAFVVVLQIAIALLLIARPSRRSIGVPRALDLFFASHAPWSLWMLTVAAIPGAGGRPTMAVVAALGGVALAMTARAIAAFFREVLQYGAWRAAAMTLAHQAITWSVFVALYGYAVALPPRVIGWFGS